MTQPLNVPKNKCYFSRLSNGTTVCQNITFVFTVYIAITLVKINVGRGLYIRSIVTSSCDDHYQPTISI